MREKTYRIKTNNQELLIRKQNESDATSRWIDLQKTNLRREKLLLEEMKKSGISCLYETGKENRKEKRNVKNERKTDK